MIERLTYLCGIAVTVLSWLIGQLVADLTSVPVLYVSEKAADNQASPDATVLELKNLSRANSISKFGIYARTKPGCTIDDGKIFLSGPEWIFDKPPEQGHVEVASLMPGSSLVVRIEHIKNCDVRFSFGFDSSTPVRIVPAGIESFLLIHWLKIILVLMGAGAIVFLITFGRAFQLSKADATKRAQ